MEHPIEEQSNTPLIEDDPGIQRVKALVSFVFVAFLFAFPTLAVYMNLQTASITQTSQNPSVFTKNIEKHLAIQKLVAGYPIARMSRYLAQQDPQVASFMIAIAKKESNWGKRKPVLAGKDCYNYWGFREQRERMGSGGHTCFDSQGDAVRSVASRVKALVYEYNRKTAEDLIVWKCGYSCEGHDQEGVDKWIEDVDFYYQKASSVLQ